MKYLLPAVIVILSFGCADSGKQTVPDKQTQPKVEATANRQESIYQLNDTFQTQDNKLITLAAFTGTPTVVAMIFTHCQYACPRLTADMKGIESSLAGAKGKVNFVLISFDSDRDLPGALKTYAVQNDLGASWTLLHGSEEAVRAISVLLNVQFEKDADGNFSHSNIISVLDQQGRLRFQKEGLGADQSQTVKYLQQLSAAG